MDHSAVREQLKTVVATGLTDAEVEPRLQEYGTNELAESEVRGPLRVLWEQFRGAEEVVRVNGSRTTRGSFGAPLGSR